MKSALPIRIVLLNPPAGIVYGVQRGSGSKYSVDFAQQPSHGDVVFDFEIAVDDADALPNFMGEYVQGPKARRFIYIDVGQYAGQKNTQWSRRMIIRLDELTLATVRKALTPRHRLVARIQGTAADGGPSCATVPPIGGWKAIRAR